jgi:hypothetical protein
VVPKCMARPCVARRISESDERESCINVSGLLVEQILIAPDQHGYPRASRLTSGKTSVGRFGTQSHGCAGQTVRPSLHSIRQTSVGKLSILIYSSLRLSFDFDVGGISDSTKPLFDHVVGNGEQRRWHGETEESGGLVIYDELEFRRLHHGQLSGLGPFEDAAGADADLTMAVQNVGSVAHQCFNSGFRHYLASGVRSRAG